MNNLEQYYLDHKSDIDCSYNEFFGTLEDFPGYTISQDGNVWSNKQDKNWKKLNIQIDHQQYKYIRLLDKNGLQRKCKIHRLIARIFIPNIENKPIVCHKDDNKNNNTIDNLYWGTQYDNYNDAIKNNISNYPPIYNIKASVENKYIGSIIKKYYPNHTPSQLGQFNYMTKELQQEIMDYVIETQSSCNN